MKHGEYKTPGGKLVIVDFNVIDGRIRSMQINGDFFLEPPEVFDLLNEALDGQAADASEEHLAAVIQAAVPADAELIGFSPAGIATAIRRALS